MKAYLSNLSIGPDAVIVSSLSLLTVKNGIRLQKRFNARLGVEIRDIWPAALTMSNKTSAFHPLTLLLGWYEKMGLKAADFVIGTMPNLSKRLTQMGIQNKKVIHIPHLENARIEYQDLNPYQSFFEDLKLKKQTIITYSGSINSSSGLQYFLDAACQIENPFKFQFVLLGAGPLLDTFKSKYSDIVNVHFLDKVKQEQVLSILSDSDILFDGYSKSELYQYGNSRNKYVEYCMAKKPIIMAYEGYPMFVETQHCGIVCEPESAKSIIAAVKKMDAKSTLEQEKMGENAYHYFESNLRIKSNVDQLEALLNV